MAHPSDRVRPEAPQAIAGNIDIHPPGVNKGRRRIQSIAALFFLALLWLPFLSKPAYIDDWVYLRLAVEMAPTPLDPYSVTGYGLGEEWRAMEGMPHPPLWPYVLLIIGGDELTEIPWLLHLFSIGLALLTAVGLARLVSRFANPRISWYVTALVILSPAFFVTATSVGTDIFAMTSTTWTLVFFMRGVDQRDRSALIASGLTLGLALLTRYSTASLIPLLILYGFLFGARLRQVVVPIAVGLAFLSVWFIQNIILYGAPHPFFIAALPEYAIPAKLIFIPATVSLLGGVASFPPLLFWLAWLRNRRKYKSVIYAAGLTVLTLSGLASTLTGEYGLAKSAALACFLLVGWLCLIAVAQGPLSAVAAWARGGLAAIRENRKAAEDLFLGSWLFLILSSNIVILPMANARYLIPLLPPLFLLLMRGGDFESLRPRLLAAGIAFSVGLSLVLATVELSAARSYPHLVKEIKTDFASPGRTIYYDGGRGSLDYYMLVLEAGRYLLNDDKSPRFGDIVVRSNLPFPLQIDDSVDARLHFLERRSTQGPIPVRLFNHLAHAGFYSQHWGLLPYAVSREPLEWVDVYVAHELVASQRALNRPAGEITPGRVIGQTFVGSGLPLTSVKLLLATYRRENTKPLLFKLTRGTENRALAEETIVPETIRDNQWYEVSFDPVEAPPGHLFQIVLEAPGASPGNAFTVWSSSEDLYPDGELVVNGQPAEGDLTFVVLSGAGGSR